MKLPLLFVFLMPVTTALACLNVKDGATLSGGHAEGISDSPAFLLRSIALQPMSKGFFVGSVSDKAPEADKLENQALQLISGGQYPAALTLLQKAEELEPGTYSLAANLGTTYELVGDNKQALTWIKKSVALNANSHGGSEWVHVLVLEAKVREDAVAGTGLKEPLVPVPDRLKKDTLLNVGGKERDALSVHRDIYHQLKERLNFVKPKDPYVADLLFSLAVLDANLSTVENAGTFLSLSREYGYSDAAKAQKLEDSFERGHLLSNIRVSVQWILGVGIFVGACYYGLRNGWIVVSRQSTRRPRTTR